MSDLPHCPKCNSEYTYQDAGQYMCPECAHEWSARAFEDASEGSGEHLSLIHI